MNGCSGLPATFAMLNDHGGKDAAPNIPARGDPHEPGTDGSCQIVEDAIGHCLMESALVTERPHVVLERFEFNIAPVWHIVDDEQREVGLAGEWAQAGELRHFEVDQVVAPWAWVRKNIQYF